MVRKPIEGVVYPPADAVARYRTAGALVDETLGQALHAAARQFPDRIALATPDVRLTYCALNEITDKVAAAFLRLGLKPLDRAIFQLGNVAELFYALYGCFEAGIIPVCSLATHREAEIGFLAPFTQAKLHSVQGDLEKFDLPAFALRMKAMTGVEHIVTARGADRPGLPSLQTLIANEDAAAARRTIEALDVDPWNVGIFQLSGGTTGIPKVIPRFHND